MRNRFNTHCDYYNHTKTSQNHLRSHQKFSRSCNGTYFFWGLAKQLFFTVPLPSPNRGKPPILQMALQSPFFFFKVKWRSCLSIFWKPSLICPQLLKPHFDKLLHRYVRWLKTRWASSTGMMLGEGLKSVKKRRNFQYNITF